MSYTVTGVTVETNGLTKEQMEQMKIFSGKNAGICYMGDSYFDSSVSEQTFENILTYQLFCDTI